MSATNPPRIVTEGGLIAVSEDAVCAARSDVDRRKAETTAPTLAGRSGVARA